MIERLYVNNFRCLQNFELDLRGRSSVLFLGANGTGKSTVGRVLEILKNIASGENRLRTNFDLQDFSNYDRSRSIVIECRLRIDNDLYDYCLNVHWPESFREPKVLCESFSFNGEPQFDRDEAQVEIIGGPKFLVDWHNAGLSVIQMKGDSTPIERLRRFLASAILLKPQPATIDSVSDGEALTPDLDCSNLAHWFSGIISEYPAAYGSVQDYLKQRFEDFSEIQNRTIGEVTKRLLLKFERDGVGLDLPLGRLSDGERIQVIVATLLAVTHYQRPTQCWWDEPENHVGLAELGIMMTSLRKAFERDGGQMLVTSHNPEVIRHFSDDNTLLFWRDSHLAPTRTRYVSEIQRGGDIVESILTRDLVPADG